MNLFELFVKIGVDDQASGKLKDIGGKLGNGLKTAAKIGTAAVGAAAAGITALTTAAINNYAEYEQLVGGVETLFNESAERVKQYASEAFRSAGLSANEYMSTVTGFSASLLQSLGRGAQTDLDALKENLDEQYDATKKSWQDRIKIAKKLKQNNVAELEAQMNAELKAQKKGNEQKLAEAEAANNKSVVTAETQALAADLANQAVIDMADNAAKMGTSMELIQNAYAGFSKQNYTMLDNLKLGYGGTASEMQRLIKDAAALDSSIDANSMSFANIVKAINVVQTQMGITGTTAKEAGRTISGSIGAMRSAWQNLLTGIASDDVDFEKTIDDFVKTIVGDGTENNLGVFGNIIPRVEVALNGVVDLIDGLLPKIAEKLPSLVSSVLPNLVGAASSLLTSLANAIPPLLSTIANEILPNLLSQTIILFGSILDIIPSLVETLTSGIQKLIPMMIDSLTAVVTKIASSITKIIKPIIKALPVVIKETMAAVSKNLPIILRSLIDLAMELVAYFPEIATVITDAIPMLYEALIPAIIDNLPILLEGLVVLFIELVKHFPEMMKMGLATSSFGLFFTALNTILKTYFGETFGSIFNKFVEWLKNLPGNIYSSAKDAFSSIVSSIAEFLSELPGKAKDIATDAVDKFVEFFSALPGEISDIGGDIVEGLWEGIKGSWNWLTDKVEGLFSGLVGGVKNILGIASPSKVFKKLGAFTADGFGIGFDDEFASVKSDMEDAMNFDSASVGVGLSSTGFGYGSSSATTIGNITINVNGAKYDDEQSLATAIAQEIQNMTERRSAVYA